MIEEALRKRPFEAGARIPYIGCGAGPGGVVAATAASAAQTELVLADINPRALEFARANAMLADHAGASFALGDLFNAVQGSFGLIVANPPYLVDAAARTYRHGGGPLGSGLSERIVAESLPRLVLGGRLVLYTGVAMVQGVDAFLAALQPLLQRTGWPWSYRELDPDVFGEELDTAAYAHADRIAAVALVIQRPLQ